MEAMVDEDRSEQREPNDQLSKETLVVREANLQREVRPRSLSSSSSTSAQLSPKRRESRQMHTLIATYATLQETASVPPDPYTFSLPDTLEHFQN
uniref:Uncharacterized protein n=1 Tax=Mesocestoides corti TaxID=53468 RepID=A0A5K3G527_MESCO